MPRVWRGLWVFSLCLGCSGFRDGHPLRCVAPQRSQPLASTSSQEESEVFDERLKTLTVENAGLQRENAALRREIEHMSLSEGLSDVFAFDTLADVTDLGKGRVTAALRQFNEEHPPSKRVGLEGNLQERATRLHALLPSLKQSARAKETNLAAAAALRSLLESTSITAGSIVEGTVRRVMRTGVNIELEPSRYVALLRAAEVTAVDDAPTMEFLSKTFPLGGRVVCEVMGHELNGTRPALYLSTQALERHYGEMSLDPAMVYRRALIERGSVLPYARDTEYLSGLELFGAGAYTRGSAAFPATYVADNVVPRVAENAAPRAKSPPAPR